MRRAIRGSVIAALLCIWAVASYAQDGLKFVELGDFPLESGNVIRGLRLAYRTLGTLNADKSNAILFPTWLAGTTAELIESGFIGPGKLADIDKYFVIAIDAFGNGISSSPSNSRLQPDKSFPNFTIRDMVKAQHILLTEHLHLSSLHAVIGISMGAMQVFQWMVSYPTFIANAISISGTPKLTSYDLLVWWAELGVIDTLKDLGHGCGRAMKATAVIHTLLLRTPDYYATQLNQSGFTQFLADSQKALMKYNPYDWALQLQAMIDHNIYKTYGDSPENAAGVIKARVLIVTSLHDNVVYPGPARELAGVLKAEIVELTGNCGHLAFLCEKEALHDAVSRFLNNK